MTDVDVGDYDDYYLEIEIYWDYGYYDDEDDDDDDCGAVMMTTAMMNK